MILIVFGSIVALVILIWFLFTLTDIKRATQGTEKALRELIEFVKHQD